MKRVATSASSIEARATRAARRHAALAEGLETFVAAARSFPDVEAVYVYGSFARDSVGPNSDLDLVIVRRTSLRGPARGEDLVERALPGVSFDLTVLTPEEFTTVATHESGYWYDALHDARLVYHAARP